MGTPHTPCGTSQLLRIHDEAFKQAFLNQVREAIYDTLTDKNQSSKPDEGFTELTVVVMEKLKVLHPEAWAGFPDSCTHALNPHFLKVKNSCKISLSMADRAWPGR
jgi:hypothetical protein